MEVNATTQVTDSDEPVPMFAGAITITAMQNNPDPTENVMVEVAIQGSGTSTGVGTALAITLKAFVDSMPADRRQAAMSNAMRGFVLTLQDGGVTEVARRGLQS